MLLVGHFISLGCVITVKDFSLLYGPKLCQYLYKYMNNYGIKQIEKVLLQDLFNIWLPCVQLLTALCK